MTSTIHIDAPPDRVFDYVDEWRNATKYLRRLVRWEPADPGRAHEVGAVYMVGLEAAGKRLNGKLEVTDYRRPSAIRIRAIEGTAITGGWTFEPEGSGTRVVLDADYQLPGGIVGRIVSAFVSRHAQADLDGSLRDLKRLVESAP